MGAIGDCMYHILTTINGERTIVHAKFWDKRLSGRKIHPREYFPNKSGNGQYGGRKYGHTNSVLGLLTSYVRDYLPGEISGE